MSQQFHRLRPIRKEVQFDIERSSYYRLLSEERAAIGRHQREIEETSGVKVDLNCAVMSWVCKHRWEWRDRQHA